MRIPSSSVRRRPRIEIIPLIDIMFFLLATFVMVSLSMVKNRGIPVRLPAAASAGPQERKSFVTVTVTQAGEIYLDKEAVGLKGLSLRLSKMRQANPSLRVFINGDERAPFGSVARVLDEVRLLGITTAAIQTRNLQEPGRADDPGR